CDAEVHDLLQLIAFHHVIWALDSSVGDPLGITKLRAVSQLIELVLRICVAARQIHHAIFAQVDGYSINPSTELGITSEPIDGFEDLHEYLLCHVFSLVAAAKHAEDQTEYSAFVDFYQLDEGACIVRLQTLDEPVFVTFRHRHVPRSRRRLAVVVANANEWTRTMRRYPRGTHDHATL